MRSDEDSSKFDVDPLLQADTVAVATVAALEARPVICPLGSPAGVSVLLEDSGFTLTGVQAPALGDESHIGTIAAPIGTSAQIADILLRLGFCGPGSSARPCVRSRSRSTPSLPVEEDLADHQRRTRS